MEAYLLVWVFFAEWRIAKLSIKKKSYNFYLLNWMFHNKIQRIIKGSSKDHQRIIKGSSKDHQVMSICFLPLLFYSPSCVTMRVMAPLIFPVRINCDQMLMGWQEHRSLLFFRKYLDANILCLSLWLLWLLISWFCCIPILIVYYIICMK